MKRHTSFPKLENLVIQYAVEMSRTQVEVSDALFDALKRHLDDRQMVELTSAIAWENYRARFNHALGIEAERFSKNRFCPLPVRAAGGTG